MMCPASFALEHGAVSVDGSNPDAGRERHARYERDVPDDVTSRWPGYTWSAEIKVWYDLASDTGGIHGQGNDRAYDDRGPFVVFGTADLIGRADGDAVVLDYKGFNAQTPAARNPQVSILALAVSRAWRVPAVTVAIRPEVGAMDVARLEALELDAFAATARDALSEVVRVREMRRAGMPVRVNEGSWCTYCPALAACPAKQALALMARNEPPLSWDLADDRTAADAYDFAARVRQLLKRLDGAIYARAAERPIPLNDGRVLSQVTAQGNETLDGDVMWRVVAEKHGRDIADAAVIRSATKKRLKEALQLANVESVAKAERDVLEAVRAAGGSERKETTRIEAVERVLKAGSP
jgi:hypothetical protein